MAATTDRLFDLITTTSEMHALVNAQVSWLKILYSHASNFTALSDDGGDPRYAELSKNIGFCVENLVAGHNFIATHSNKVYASAVSVRDYEPGLNSLLCKKELAAATEKLLQAQLAKNEAKAALELADDDAQLVKVYYNAINAFKYANATLVSVQEKCAVTLLDRYIDIADPYSADMSDVPDNGFVNVGIVVEEA